MVTVFIIILAILAIITIIAVQDEDAELFIMVPIIIIVTFAIIIIVNLDSYKEGQVDAITGKINYKLVTHPDSTKTWEKIQEDKR